MMLSIKNSGQMQNQEPDTSDISDYREAITITKWKGSMEKLET
jgi:hypothetical protein